jgi:chromosome segregation and condensation protein ScpB
VRTGLSAARAYGWTELHPAAGQTWRLDAYLPLEAFSALQQHADRSSADTGSDAETEAVPVVLRVVDSQAGIESVRGTSRDSAISTLLHRQLIALDDHRLFSTTPAFLKYLGLRDLADLPALPPLPELETEAGVQC